MLLMYGDHLCCLATSKYSSQDNVEPFLVTLNTDPKQLADGYYIEGSPGGNSAPEDLEYYTEMNGELVRIN